MTRAGVAVGFLLWLLPAAGRAIPELEETREIVFSAAKAPEVAQLATELGSPVAIYEYVRNRFDYLPYYGIRGGARNTLWRKGGNDLDLAALLIAMLRSQGVPARYVVGTIVVPDDDLAAWLGVATRADALRILDDSAVPTVDRNTSGVITLPHVWVEALLSVTNYRGIARPSPTPACAAESADCRWVALDPSFKRYDVLPPSVDGLAAALNFDYAAYHRAIKDQSEALKNKNPVEILEDRILAANPGRSLSEVVGQVAITPAAAGILPGSLPYRVVPHSETTPVIRYASALARDGSSCAADPYAWTRCIGIQLSAVGGATPRVVREFFVPVDHIAVGDPIGVTIVSTSTPAPCGGATPCDAVAVRNPATGQTTIDYVHLLDTEQYYLGIESHVVPGTTGEFRGFPIARNGTYVLTAGGVEANATQVSRAIDGLLAFQNGGRVLQAPDGTLFVDVNADGYYQVPPDLPYAPGGDHTRALLHIAGCLYMDELRMMLERLAALTQTRVTPRFHFGLVSAQAQGIYVDGAPFAVIPNGLLIDVRADGQKPYRLNGATPTYYREIAKLATYAGSSLEHEIWQQLTGFDAISTVRGFQKALYDDASLLTVDDAADLPPLFQATGFQTSLPGFSHQVYNIASVYPPITDKPTVWRATGSSQYFSMLRPTVTSDTDAVQRFPMTYYAGNFDIAIGPTELEYFGDAGAARVVSDYSWPRLIECVYAEWDNYKSLAGSTSVAPRSLCLAQQFSAGTVANLRISLANQYAVAKAAFNAYTGYEVMGLGQPIDIASYIDELKGFSAGAVRYRAETDANRPRLVLPGLLTDIRDDFLGLTLPAFTWGETLVPSARVTEPSDGVIPSYGVWYEFKDAGSTWESTAAIDLATFSAGGGYVVGDEALTDWSTDSSDETVFYDNQHYTDQVLVTDANNSPRCSCTKDPVSTATGNMYHDETDFVIAAQPFDFVFTRTYNSRLSRTAQRFSNRDADRNYWPLGPGWTHSYAMMLIGNDFGATPNVVGGQNADGVVSSITFVDERGGELNFPVTGCPSACAATSPAGFFGTLAGLNSATPSIAFPDGRRFVFRTATALSSTTGVALIETIEDGDGRAMTIARGDAGAFNRTDTVTDALGRSIQLRHTAGRLTSVADWASRTWTFSYDSALGAPQRLASVTNPLSRSMTYGYQVGPEGFVHLDAVEASGGAIYRLTAIRHPQRAVTGGSLQRRMDFDYFANGRAASRTDAMGHVERYDYNLFERRTAVTDMLGFVREHINDARGGLAALVQEDGNALRFASTAADNLRCEKRDAYGRATLYSYAANESLQTPADRGGNVTLERDPHGHDAHYAYAAQTTKSGRPAIQLTGVEEKNGEQRQLLYCPADTATENTPGCVRGKLWKVVLPLSITLQEYGYFPDGTLRRLTERVDPADPNRKRITEYVYDTATRLRPDGKIVSGTTTSNTLQWRYTYDPQGLGRLFSESLELDADSPTHPGVQRIQTTYGYDALDRVTSVTQPDGSTTYTDYDEDGNPWRVRRRYANETERRLAERTFDAAGRMTSETDVFGKTTRWTYDAMDHVLSATDRNGHTTTHVYDAKGQRTQTIDANGHVVTTAYDPVGDPVAVTTAAGTTRFVHDALGRVTETVSALGHRSRQRYDPAGRTLGLTDANVVAGTRTGNAFGESVTSTYDALGRVETVTDADGGVTRYEYDLLGNRTAVIDAKQQRTSFAYNDLGQLERITDPRGRSTVLTYDRAGQVATRTDRNGRLTRYVYDAADRLTGLDFASTGPGLDETRTYDDFGDLVSIGNAHVTYTLTYDQLHRLKSKTDSRSGEDIEWRYDAVGNVIEREGYDESDTTLTYDSTNRLVAMSNPDYLGATYHYDGAGRLVDRIFSNGARTTLSWDADGRLTEVVQLAAGGSQLSRERYCLDAVGTIATVLPGSSGTCAAPAGDRTAYTYDDLYRLTGESVTANGATSPKTVLSYDAVGNIATAYGDADPLPGRVYTTDAANRLTAIAHNGSPVFTFDYDFEGNRTAKRAASGTVLESYAYDDQNRLVSLTAGGQTTTYTYDPFGYRIGQRRGSEQRLDHLDGEHLEAVYTPQGQPLATYLRGAVIDELVGAYHYDAAGRGTFAAFGHDRLTSVARLADHTGATVQTYTYGPFGADRTATGASPNRLKYTGREQDPSGFYYYRARYYDPATRRFLTEDPLGFAAGPNLYAYVDNNPLMGTDPRGMDTLQIGWAGTVTIPFIGAVGTGGAGIAIDTSGSIGTYAVGGAGAGVGGGAGAGVSVAYSNAQTINDLGGDFWNASLHAGAGLGGALDVFTGRNLDGSPITGGGITFGASVEASANVTWTYTVVSPLSAPRTPPARDPFIVAGDHRLPGVTSPYDKPWR